MECILCTSALGRVFETTAHRSYLGTHRTTNGAKLLPRDDLHGKRLQGSMRRSCWRY